MAEQNYQNTVKETDIAGWESDVLNSQVPVFVDFWAPWCGPCRATAPVIEELATEYSGRIRFVKVNIDDNASLAARYNVFSIPTLALFNKGHLITQQVGARSKASYQNMIEKQLEVQQS